MSRPLAILLMITTASLMSVVIFQQQVIKSWSDEEDARNAAFQHDVQVAADAEIRTRMAAFQARWRAKFLRTMAENTRLASIDPAELMQRLNNILTMTEDCDIPNGELIAKIRELLTAIAQESHHARNAGDGESQTDIGQR